MNNKILKEKIKSLNLDEKGNAIKPENIKLNREQKRSLLKRHGIHTKEANKIFKKSAKVVLDILPEDTKVKLNYDRIMNDGAKKSQAYIDFVEAHKDEELTAYQDEKHEGTSLYLLREDEADEDVKWVFDISDLIYDEDAILTELLHNDNIDLDENNMIINPENDQIESQNDNDEK